MSSSYNGPPSIAALARLTRRETFRLAVFVAATAAGALWYLSQPTVLTVAVAPRDGTEPGLFEAYAKALDQSHEKVRLKILSFGNVDESALALQDGRADLAVVRPDVLLPTNGLTLAILRDQAMMILSPEQAGIRSFPDLAGKKLGIGVHRDADYWLLQNILRYFGLDLQKGEAADKAKPLVRLEAVDEDAVGVALSEGKIDAFVSIIAPTSPMALALVDKVRSTAKSGKANFVAIDDEKAIIERFPKLQAVTLFGGIFSGAPKLPEKDVKTIGASYRLMARSTLSRVVAADITQQLFEKRPMAAKSTDAAEYILAPAYDTTAAATSARIPIHPGAIDYYQREQRGFIERYGNTLYLLGVLAGAIISVSAWLRRRLARLRREQIDDIIERLLEIIDQARTLGDADAIETLNIEVDKLAADVVRYTCEHEPEARTLSAVAIAIETARKTIADCRHLAKEQQKQRHG